MSIAIFNLVAGQAVGEPVGPNFSREDGSIKLAGNHFHANWKTSDSALPNGAKVRVELRLANAPENAPACNAQTGGVNADAGCIAFVDVQLWKNKGEVKKKGGDKDSLLDLKNGQTLPIKFFVAPGAANTSPVVAITAPENAVTFKDDEAISLMATALDLEEGDLAEGLSWTSNLVGDLGTGPSITTEPLAIGTHVITARVNDSAGRTGTASITVEVVQSAAPPTEPEVVGSTPTAFTGLGGLFSVVTVIEDVDGNPITDELELNNFSFSDISLSSVRTPDTPLTDGTAIATRLEVGGESGGPVSLAIMIDNSGSMGGNDRQRLRFDAAQQLIDQLSLPDEITVGSLNGIRQPLTTDYEKAKTVAGQNSGGSSDVYNGVIRAADELQDASNPNKAIVALTDGQTGLRNFETSVARANAINAPVYTVGLGKNLQFDKLQEIAARTGGAFGEASRAEDLERVFNAIGRSITAGGIRVTGEVTLDTPLSQAGQYILSGNLITETRGETFSTPFSFRVFIDQGDLSVLPPKLTKATPDAGATVGGTEVTLTGDNFSRVNAVLFGDVPASSFSIESNLRLRAVAPTQNVETVEITVASPEGQSNALSFTYETLPAIGTVTPAQASTLGGETIVITGSDFTNVTGVSFNGVAATRFTVDSETQITATVPATDKEGTVNLSVSAAVGPSNVANFTYLAPPSLSAVSPDSSLVEGGVTVTLTGADLSEVDTATFGSVEATFTVNSDTRITATVPAGSKGSIKLNVRSPYGQSNALDFTYTTIPAPTLNTLSTREGTSAGGTSVVLTGENLAGVTSVSFGGKTANFTQNSDTQITVTSPAGTGSVDVKVVTAGGTSNALGFSYIEPPVLTSISPNEGPTTGGTEVALSGENLSRVTSVKFDGVAARFTVESGTRIVVTAPAGNEGRVDVEVSSLFGVSGTTSFTYVAPLVQAPVIKSFFASEVTQLSELSWKIDEFSGEQLTCEINFGEYRGADLGSEQLADCMSVGSANFFYPEGGEYTATLQVKNSSGEMDTATTTFKVIQQASQEVAFDTSLAQAAWQKITNTPEVSRLGLAFNTDAALVVEVDSTLGFIVPGTKATDHTIGVVSGNSVDFVLHMTYRVSDDVYILRNVLDNRVITISSASQYAGSPIASSKLEALASQMVPLLSSPLLDYNPLLSSVPRSSLLYASCLQQVSNTSDPCAQKRAGARRWLTYSLYAGAVNTGFIFGTAYACGTGNVVGCSIALPSAPASFAGFIFATRTAANAQQAYKACLRQNFNVESGSSVIATVSPPLPFSNQVFVQSVPDNVNLATGFLTPDSSASEIANLLESAIPNAEFIFEEFSNTFVLEGGTQVDAHFREIITTYISRTSALSNSGCGLYPENMMSGLESSPPQGKLDYGKADHGSQQSTLMHLGAYAKSRREVQG